MYLLYRRLLMTQMTNKLATKIPILKKSIKVARSNCPGPGVGQCVYLCPASVGQQLLLLSAGGNKVGV